MHICVLGAGGLGGLIGARLAESGVDVTLIARPAHVEAIARDGLSVTGAGGKRVVRAHVRAVVDAAAVSGHVDYLMLAVKTRDTAHALAGASSLRERVGVALSLQNSATKDHALAAWFGEDRVIGAVTTEAGTMLGPGEVRIVSTAPTSRSYFGELDGRPSSRVASLVEAFERAGMLAQESATIDQVLWEKLLQISTVAGFSTSTVGHLPGGSMAHALTVREGAEHYVQLASELLAVYRAMGFEPQDYFAPFSAFRRLASVSFDEAVTDAMALGTLMLAADVVGRPSMHEDVLRGKPTEVEDSLGIYVANAARLNVAAPTVLAAYRVVKTLEQLGELRP